MKIDLHCHTKKTKSGDSKNRNVTPELFRKKIELSDVKIVAITNHNAFDLNQYLLLRDIVNDICQVWPGIEIDIDGESKYHLIVVTKPEDANEFSKMVDILLANQSPDDFSCTLEDVYNTFNSFEAIYIPHFHDKKPAISENDKNKLLNLIGDPARVFIEPRNHRTLGVLANKDLNVLIGSDVQDWNKYERSTFADLRLPVGNYSEFLLLARRDQNVVDTLLNKKEPVKLIGSPYNGVKLPLKLYPDINIIFGPKGTGKTEILKSLNKSMVKDGINCKSYIASDRNEEFKNLLNTNDMDLDLNKINANSCESEIKFILEWNDTNPVLIKKYEEWLKTKGNSNNKNRMKITEAVHDIYKKSTFYDNHRENIYRINDIKRLLKNIDISMYLSEEHTVELNTLIEELINSIYSSRREDYINEMAVSLANNFIDKIKSYADNISDTVSRPSTVGLKMFALGRINLFKAVNCILQTLSIHEFDEQHRLGSLEGKGTIYINYKYRMLCKESTRNEFVGNKINISTLKEIKKGLEDIRKNIFDNDVSIEVDKIKQLLNDNVIKDITPFLGRSKQLVDEKGQEYEPSNGEKGILLLEKVLFEEADAYFLDEPELGMGNSYIDNDIRPLLCSLAKRRKYVVVATHNANIAVRTLPYMSIYRTHENGVYNTYIGNPFDDKLVNIFDEADIKSWTEESIHSLEGGRDAFYTRRDIYESNNN